MKLYQLVYPILTASPYTYAVRLGSWEHVKGKRNEGICSACRTRNDARTGPVIAEWDEGDDRPIGDFTSLFGYGLSLPLMREDVFSALAGAFRACVPVTVTFNPPKKARTRKAHAGDPPLIGLATDHVVDADLTRSTIVQGMSCSRCGYQPYSVHGLEHREKRPGPNERTIRYVRIPRVPGQGIFVRARDIAGIDIFLVNQLALELTCTQRVRDFIEARRFTNIDFREVGEVIP